MDGRLSLAKRMKRYELTTRHYLIKKIPVIIRVDGKAFHTLTKGMDKPFDRTLMEAMAKAAFKTSQHMQGFKAAYIQSDEVTFLLTDYDSIETDAWFDYNIAKLVSISASYMSLYFYTYMEKLAVFDSRAFNVPVEDVVNNFLWRAKDWERNSLQMYARSFFSHKELLNKNHNDIHEMLHDIGKNWATDLDDICKNGTFIYKDVHIGYKIKPITEQNNVIYNIKPNIKPSYDEISKIIIPLLYPGMEYFNK